MVAHSHHVAHGPRLSAPARALVRRAAQVGGGDLAQDAAPVPQDLDRMVGRLIVLGNPELLIEAALKVAESAGLPSWGGRRGMVQRLLGAAVEAAAAKQDSTAALDALLLRTASRARDSADRSLPQMEGLVGAALGDAAVRLVAAAATRPDTLGGPGVLPNALADIHAAWVRLPLVERPALDARVASLPLDVVPSPASDTVRIGLARVLRDSGTRSAVTPYATLLLAAAVGEDHPTYESHCASAFHHASAQGHRPLIDAAWARLLPRIEAHARKADAGGLLRVLSAGAPDLAVPALLRVSEEFRRDGRHRDAARLLAGHPSLVSALSAAAGDGGPDGRSALPPGVSRADVVQHWDELGREALADGGEAALDVARHRPLSGAEPEPQQALLVAAARAAAAERDAMVFAEAVRAVWPTDAATVAELQALGAGLGTERFGSLALGAAAELGVRRRNLETVRRQSAPAAATAPGPSKQID